MGNQTFSSTGSWVCPTGVSSVTVECWGGGGAGGVASGTASGAGGGAGGQYAKKVVSVSAGTSYTVTVGAVATAVTTGGVVTNGNDSWFNTTGTVIAKGGAGGADATGTTGAGGTGSTTGGIGDTVFAGGSGASGVSSTQSGGGGGGAGSGGTGSSASGATAGTATATNGGAGGAGVSTANTQNPGSNYGGGGSGGLSSSATNRKGGDGAQGLVVLTWDLDLSIIKFPYTDSSAQRLDRSKRVIIGPHQAFVPQVSVASTTVYVSGQSVDPSFWIASQYSTLAQPVQVGGGAAETLTLDKWAVDSPVPCRYRRGQSQVGDQPLQIPIAAETLTLDKWSAQSQDQFKRPQRVILYVANRTLVEAAATPNLEWSIQQPVPRGHRQRFKDYSSGALTTGPGPSETVSIDKWLTDLTIRFTPRAFREGRTAQQLPFEQLTLDKWQLQGTEPQRRIVKARQGFYVLPSQPSEAITIDKWYAPDRVIRRQRISVDSRTAFVKVAPFEDLISLDKWLSYQSPPYPLRRVREGQFSFYVIPILTIPSSSLPALWRNEATLSLLAADLQAIGVQAEDVQSVSVMAVSLEETDLVTENSALVSVITKDEQSITILYEDVRSI